MYCCYRKHTISWWTTDMHGITEVFNYRVLYAALKYLYALDTYIVAIAASDPVCFFAQGKLKLLDPRNISGLFRMFAETSAIHGKDVYNSPSRSDTVERRCIPGETRNEHSVRSTLRNTEIFRRNVETSWPERWLKIEDSERQERENTVQAVFEYGWYLGRYSCIELIMAPRKKQVGQAAPDAPTRVTRSRKKPDASVDISSEPQVDAQSQSNPADAPKPTRGRKRVTPAATNGVDLQPQPDAAKPQSEATPATKPARGRKRDVAATTDGTELQAQEPPKKVKTEPPSADDEVSSKAEQTPELENAQIAKPGARIPLDEGCPLAQYEVYIDDSGVIYDASLNQTNAGNNNNKFYMIQLLRNASGNFKTWTRWGRVGEPGQNAILGDGSLEDALNQFNKKFKDKSGLSWINRGDPPKIKKYTFVEKSYAVDSDDEDDASGNGEAESADGAAVPDSKLDTATQELMELIFNQQYFNATMSDLNYDSAKLPLGKLSKSTILRGFQALKDLSALMDDMSLAQTKYNTSYAQAIESLSNAYFSLIPHAFGRNKPPVISNDALLKKEIELLESLGDMKDAAAMMKNDKKDEERLNILDRQFQGLGLEEMTPLKNNTPEFLELKNYLMDTRGHTHNANYQVQQIFRIERRGEKDRFESSQFAGPVRDRRLLWHGSRCTNFGGILSQGLRIAPPEAPVSGYMFGKGIYLADMSSKSANYCCSYISNGHALLLLCEAELGDPIQILKNAAYTAGDDAKANGMWSTWGQGLTGPSLWKDAECVHPSLKGIKMPDTTAKPGATGVPGAYLQYNEYITYDVSQVRLRYLFRVRM
ncbi:poly polymerase catalytic domain-containing protein [Xylariales sp. PMI_506]|nr:poly polymerase catalytic domain-containing protein [Xylariales sp. PMI_506]